MQQMRSGCNGRGVGGVVVPVRVGVAPYESCPCCCKGVVAAAARTATGVLLLLLLMLAALAFDRSDHPYLVRPSRNAPALSHASRLTNTEADELRLGGC